MAHPALLFLCFKYRNRSLESTKKIYQSGVILCPLSHYVKEIGAVQKYPAQDKPAPQEHLCAQCISKAKNRPEIKV